MLRPGARRKDVLRQLHRSTEQLVLPWLCPALLRYHNQANHRRSITQPARSIGSYTSKRSISQTSRNHATPVTVGDSYIPFETIPYSHVTRPWSDGSPGTDLSGFDTSSLVILDEGLHERGGQVHDMKSKDGVSGDATEMRIVYQACLQLGRYKRATALLTRFAYSYAEDRATLMALNNLYIQAMVEDIIKNRKVSLMPSLQRWFELDMRETRLTRRGIEPDATTYALMIKASLHALHGSKRDRTVRRYWALAKEDGIENEVLGLRVLTDSEMGKVTEICPMDLNSFDFVIPEFESEVSTTNPVEESQKTTQDNIPEVRPAPQKGLGLVSLKKSLSLFSEHSQVTLPPDLEGTPEERQELLAQMRQERLERDAISSALERWRKENDDLRAMGIDPSLQTKSVGSDLWLWSQALRRKIQEELHEVELAEEKEKKSDQDRLRCGYGPFLGLVSPERLAVITIVGMMQKIVDKGKPRITLTSAAIAVGQWVAKEYEAETSLKERDAASMTASSFNKRGQSIAKMLRKKHQRLSMLNKNVAATGIEPALKTITLTWTTEIQGKVGALLLSLLIDSAKMAIPVKDPETKKTTITEQKVFFHDRDYIKGRPIGVIRTAPAMLAKLSKEPHSTTVSKQLPMVCEPKPWRNVRDGGFLTERYDVLRWQEVSQRRYLQAAADKGDLDEILAGLDVLGRTPWQINRRVLAVMLEAWNSGEEIGKFKPESPTVEYPPKPENTEDRVAMKKYYREVLALDNQVNGYHSERCFHNLQLEIAKGYANEKFYFPHSMDFRGRAYPLSSYLNQMGADHCRGLLMFGNGKPLGANGLRWLKIQLANVYGYDKASLQEREDFATNHLSEIYDSMSNPLGGKRWWLKAEDPWQTLAACIELTKALDSPDPTAYVSHLPVHQDGSCNGLQHYAALGGDIIGAQQVNLEPGDRPADVYTGVAEMVKKEIKEDAASGLQIAKDLEDKITRKVVKQPVMTNVYGVTFIGAKAQVTKQLVNLIPGLPFSGEGFTYDRASLYITKKIFKSLSKMFTGAHEIQYWFGLCGARITASISPAQIDKVERGMSFPKATRKTIRVYDTPDFKTSIIWTTPLKLPVVQPYRKNAAKRIKTVLQDVSIQSPNTSHVVDKRRQLQAFPPNFIHSLDATHMILSALKCDEIGLNFAAVHDSFWTHPCDVDTMSRVLRDAFIRMHSDNIIGRLAAEFNARYKSHLYLCQIPSNTPIAKRIKAHRTAVGPTLRGQAIDKRLRFREVVLERKRLQLLASADPKEVEEGKAMITPGSIFAEHAASPVSAADIASIESGVAQTQLGHVPKTPEQMEAATKAEESSPASTHEIEDLFTDETHEETETAEEADAAEAAEDGDAVAVAAKDGEGAAEAEKPRKKAKKPIQSKVWLWLPLTFPEVPKKGDFDVARLRDSTYFFS